MLVLKGNAAAVMLVAKNALQEAGASDLARLRVAIAAMCGLTSGEGVRVGSVLRIVAALHDDLTAEGLIRNPAQTMVESLSHYYVTGEPTESALELMLSCMLSNIRLMRIRTEDGVRIVDWESNLPTTFVADVEALSPKKDERAAATQ